jgi:hypothetical protein
MPNGQPEFSPMVDVTTTPPRVNGRRRGRPVGYKVSARTRIRMRVGQLEYQAAIRHDRELVRILERQNAQLIARVADLTRRATINGRVANGFVQFDELRQAWAAWCQQHPSL